jgi:hypothetical protein
MNHVAREGTATSNVAKPTWSCYDDDFKLMLIQNVAEINCAAAWK